VLVGSGTLRAERYGRLVRDPALRDARVREGLSADPLGAVLSRSLDLPLDAGFFADPASRTVAFTSAPAPARDWPAGLELVELDPGELTLTTALRRLRAQHGVRSVLCEGGPTVLGLLLAERMLDELFLTVAPKVAGGTDEPAIVTGVPMPAPVGLRLVWVLEAAGSLYLRYAVPPDPARAQPVEDVAVDLVADRARAPVDRGLAIRGRDHVGHDVRPLGGRALAEPQSGEGLARRERRPVGVQALKRGQSRALSSSWAARAPRSGRRARQAPRSA
jgi:riboflavin biosynthesis pyrimidine reductase